MKPTTIGTPTSVASVLPSVTSASNLPAVIIPPSFPVALTPEERTTVIERVASSTLAGTELRNIALLGAEEENALHQVLDQFLIRIDRFDNPQLFKLFERLQSGVDEKDLPALAEKIMADEPSLGDKVKMLIMSKKARQALLAKIWEQTQSTLRGNTKSLVDLVNQLERELNAEQQKLDHEITSLEELKGHYKERFRGFAATTVYMQVFLEQARAEVANREQSADLNDPIQRSEIDELRSKLQALESRALALEGTLTRLPADQLVIHQLETAAIATLQETSTTASARFASIKMTLITLNGALLTKSVQRLNDQGAALDANLQAVRGQVMKQIVTTAANAPGDNRLAQAEQLRKIVSDTAELRSIVEEGRVNNKRKFGEARQLFAQAREDMVKIATS